MKTFPNIVKRLPVLILAAILLSSCTREESVEVPNPEKPVTFLLDLPAPAVIETRSTGTVNENHIDDLTILAFDKVSGQLLQKTSLTSASLSTASGAVDGNRWQFTTRIVSGNHDLVALANTAEMSLALAAVSPTATPLTKSSVAQALFVSSTTKWGFTGGKVNPLPMWGELSFNTASPPASPEFKMTRMHARINVGLDPGITNFRLTSIRYYNYSRKGYLIPQAGRYTILGDGSVNIHSPSVYSGILPQTGANLLYTGSEINGYTTCENTIYVPEAETEGDFSLAGNAWKENPCLVVGGQYYDGNSWGSETFYRIDFIRGGNHFYPVLRNHSYNVTITGVDGPGYSGSDQALNLSPMNLDASSYVCNESGMRIVALDGPYYLMASEKIVELIPNADKTAEKTLVLKTNFPYGWKAAVYTDEAATIAQTDGWLNVSLLGETSATPTSGTSIQLKVPYSSAMRSIKFTAGRMSVIVIVPRTI